VPCQIIRQWLKVRLVYNDAVNKRFASAKVASMPTMWETARLLRRGYDIASHKALPLDQLVGGGGNGKMKGAKQMSNRCGKDRRSHEGESKSREVSCVGNGMAIERLTRAVSVAQVQKAKRPSGSCPAILVSHVCWLAPRQNNDLGIRGKERGRSEGGERQGCCRWWPRRRRATPEQRNNARDGATAHQQSIRNYEFPVRMLAKVEIVE
jgi:hypothetical protein